MWACSSRASVVASMSVADRPQQVRWRERQGLMMRSPRVPESVERMVDAASVPGLASDVTSIWGGLAEGSPWAAGCRCAGEDEAETASESPACACVWAWDKASGAPPVQCMWRRCGRRQVIWERRLKSTVMADRGEDRFVGGYGDCKGEIPQACCCWRCGKTDAVSRAAIKLPVSICYRGWRWQSLLECAATNKTLPTLPTLGNPTHQ